MDKAQKIVEAIVEDLSGRRGLGQEWVNSLKWNVKAILEELDNLDVPAIPAKAVAEPATK